MMTCALEYFVEVPSKAAPSWREKKGWINIYKTREYLEFGIQGNPKSLPLQGMEAQPLQSLFVRGSDERQLPNL